MKILEMNRIIKKFKQKRDFIYAVNGVDLSVEKGEVISIIGPSGSGKSTLLRCINNLEKINSGEIIIAGEKVVENNILNEAVYKSEKELRRICSKTSMVFQHFNLFPHLSCLQNITIAMTVVQKKDKAYAIEKAEELLEKVGLTSKRDSYPEQLSGGQKQRVAIARALATEPEIMLFDEPTSALDPEITGEVLSVLKKLTTQNITMIVVTHEMSFAREASERVIFMDNGEIIEEAAPQELFSNPKSDRLKEFLNAMI